MLLAAMRRPLPLATLLLPVSVVAQGWLQLAAPAWTQPHPVVVTDFARQRLVTVDVQGTTWEWDGAGWREVATTTADGGLVYHARLQQTLRLDGNSGTFAAWDGHRWSPLAPPGQIYPYCMAYDAARDRVLVLDQSNTLQEWDGNRWTTFGPAPSTNWPQLVYDSARQEVLLLSNANVGAPLQTHAWNGTTWQLRASTGPATPHYGVADDPQRGRVVLHGGLGSTSSGATWEWNGTQWSLIQGSGPCPRHGHALAFDPVRGQVLTFGGTLGDTQLATTRIVQDVFARNGVTWLPVAPIAPPSRILTALHFDHSLDRVLLFGGRVAGVRDGTLWEFDGGRWHPLPVVSGSGPSGREGHGLAEAPQGGTLLFGGYDTAYRGDFFHWNGSAWTQLTPAGPSPGPRAGHGMVYDPRRQRVVVHGGSLGGLSTLPDTWEWDGQQWAQVATNGPAGIFTTVLMVWDPVAAAIRTHLTLFGNGTWQWDGIAWTNVAPALGLQVLGLGFDPGQGTTLGFVRATSGSRIETWALQGSSWVPLPGLTSPIAGGYDGSALSWSATEANGRVLHYGGTHLTALPRTPASAAEFGPACSDPAVRTPYVTSFGRPRLGDLDYRFDLRAEPLRPALVGFASRPGLVSFGPGCDWRLDSGPTVLLTLDAAGRGDLRMPLHPLPALSGQTVFVQMATLEPAARRGFTLAAPVELRLGD